MRYSKKELKGLPIPKEIVVKSLAEYIELFSNNEFENYIFRGEPTNYHDIISSALRNMEYPFIKMKNEFRREIFHRLAPDERNNFLAFAQHHGIPTNLIDFPTWGFIQDPTRYSESLCAYKYIVRDSLDYALQQFIYDEDSEEARIAKGRFDEVVLYFENKREQEEFHQLIESYPACVENYINDAKLRKYHISSNNKLEIKDCTEKNLKLCVDWSKINKKDYLTAMEKSVTNSTQIKALLQSSLTDKINDREMFMKGVDYSYYYEQENEITEGEK
jgi:hypothetical protein